MWLLFYCNFQPKTLCVTTLKSQVVSKQVRQDQGEQGWSVVWTPQISVHFPNAHSLFPQHSHLRAPVLAAGH